jgi:hypothetical protein
MESSRRMRILLLSVVAAAVAVGVTAAVAQPGSRRADAPRLAEISRYSSFKDAALPKARSLLIPPPTWPFTQTTATGETVSIHLSKRYFPTNDAVEAQAWADFFAGLVHGPELADLEAYFLTSSEVEGICGRQALACYGRDQLFAPAADPSIRLSAEAVATHEYGHHVAFNRRNDPWRAIDYGTKRWSSYEQVCTKAKSGHLYPGAEAEDHYELNPGEGFAESYRVLNERRAGLVEAPWEIVTQSLYPDARALALLEQDVLSPWTAGTSSVQAGTVNTRAKVRKFTISTPLDGRFKLTLRPATGERVSVDVLSPSSKRLAHAAGKKSLTASTTICGERALLVRVTRLAGAGTFRLALAKP